MAYEPFPYETSNPYTSYDTPYDSLASPYDSGYSTYRSTINRSSSSGSSRRRKEEYVSYFVPGYEISRQVILNWYQRLLGPSATIRPFSYQQREGYMITNAGNPLTKSQIEDLKRLSLEYEKKEASRMTSRSSVANGDEVYINQPVPVQQRRHYVPEDSYGAR